MAALRGIDSTSLSALVQLLRGAGGFPGAHRLEGAVGKAVAARIGLELNSLESMGWSGEQVADLAEAMLEDRRERERMWSWVVSGPSQEGVPTRDTGVVYRSLVQEAREEILLTSYALHRGRELLEPLRERMLEVPELRVRMVLDISRPYKDTTLTDVLVTRFTQDFTKKHWPWKPSPEVWYDPRALDMDPLRKAVLHAKCVVVDRSVALVTSANLTHAAQEKNIEAGVLVRDPGMAGELVGFFDGLIGSGVLKRLDLGARS